MSVEALAAHYHSIVIATGASSSRSLGVPGEDHAGVYDAREVVSWYNGHPDYANRPPPLHKAKHAVIIGYVHRDLLCVYMSLYADLSHPSPSLSLTATEMSPWTLPASSSSLLRLSPPPTYPSLCGICSHNRPSNVSRSSAAVVLCMLHGLFLSSERSVRSA